jgi:ABC-type glycerol-3-phosphate transport system substrate-binding protein
MRILPVAMIGLALLAACSGSTQRSAAPSSQPMATSGSAATMDTTARGDAIDRFAAAYEQQHGRRY